MNDGGCGEKPPPPRESVAWQVTQSCSLWQEVQVRIARRASAPWCRRVTGALDQIEAGGWKRPRARELVDDEAATPARWWHATQKLDAR